MRAAFLQQDSFSSVAKRIKPQDIIPPKRKYTHTTWLEEKLFNSLANYPQVECKEKQFICESTYTHFELRQGLESPKDSLT